MQDCPDGTPFDLWVVHVFDHPTPTLWWFESMDVWEGQMSPAQMVACLTRLFRDPAFLMQRFSNAQIDLGLRYLVSGAASDHMFALRDTDVPWEWRRECLHAMVTLYRDLMAPVYGDVLGHLEEVRSNPGHPNFSCYRWWTLLPLSTEPDEPERDVIVNTIFPVLREILTLRSEACAESALCGLDWWSDEMLEPIEPVVREFLEKRRDISRPLREYAERAAVGALPPP